MRSTSAVLTIGWHFGIEPQQLFFRLFSALFGCCFGAFLGTPPAFSCVLGCLFDLGPTSPVRTCDYELPSQERVGREGEAMRILPSLFMRLSPPFHLHILMHCSPSIHPCPLHLSLSHAHARTHTHTHTHTHTRAHTSGLLPLPWSPMEPSPLQHYNIE